MSNLFENKETAPEEQIQGQSKSLSDCKWSDLENKTFGNLEEEGITW